jgi:hypothetical protein
MRTTTMNRSSLPYDCNRDKVVFLAALAFSTAFIRITVS